MESRNQIFLLAGFILAGFALIGWGINTSDALIGQMLMAFGGAILGASASNILGVINGKNIYKFLVETTKEKFSSEEDTIKEFRQLYYIYWVNLLDNKFVWMCSTMDFSKSKIPGKLQADFTSKTPEGKTVLYKSEGIIRGKRLITIDKALTGNEPPAVLIYPNFAIEYTDINYGFGYFETFENRELLSPVILSETAIGGWKKQGYVDAKVSDVLWNKWEQNMNVVTRPEK